MSKPYSVRRATLADALFIADNLRQQDRAEMIALRGTDLRATLTDSLNESLITNVAVDSQGTPFVIFGLGVGEGWGYPWLLATDTLLTMKRDFLKESKSRLEFYRLITPNVTNIVDSRNTLSRRWLKWLGFKETLSISVGNETFIKVELTEDV